MVEIKQYRYPEEDIKDKLVNGNLFENIKVFRLGIMGPEGLAFILNESDNEIVINEFGIYSLDLKDMGWIEKIKFTNLDDYFSSEKLNKLYIDIIYNK